MLVSMFTFISPFSSTMVTPALPVIAEDFDISEGFMRQLVMTIFLLGYAQGPFVLAPLSEIYGRVTVLQYANLIYLVFNTACGFAQTKEQMLAFRFLSGIGGAAPQAVRLTTFCYIFSAGFLSSALTDEAIAMQWRPRRHLAQGGARQRPSHLWNAHMDQSLCSSHLWRIHIARRKLAMDLLGNINIHCACSGHSTFLSQRNICSCYSSEEGKAYQEGARVYSQRRCRAHRV